MEASSHEFESSLSKNMYFYDPVMSVKCNEREAAMICGGVCEVFL